jgi:hypothetical protein
MRVLVLTSIISLTFIQSYSQQWVTIDSTSWENVRVSYFDSLTGNYYLGGRFDTLFGVEANGIIGFDGTNWFPMGSGTNGVVGSIIRFNGDLFIAGAFDSIGNTPVRVPLVKWDGSDWICVDTISHFDDKLFSTNVLPSIQDLCEFGGKLYLCGDFYAWPNVYYSYSYADFARFNGNNIEPFLFPWVQVNCSHCNIEVFKGELYLGKNPATLDTCFGIPKTLPEGLMKVDTTCGRFIQIGQWPITHMNELMATDSILYIGMDFPSPTMGNFITGYDGTNFYPIGDGLNAPVGSIKNYRGKLVVYGPFTGNYSNTTYLPNIAQLDGSSWVPLGSSCDLSYGIQYITVLDTFIIASGFFDSCGVNPVGSIVIFPGAISTGIEENSEIISPPKVIVENSEIRVEFSNVTNSDKYDLRLFDMYGHELISSACCMLKFNRKIISSGVYILEILNRTENKKFCHKLFLSP